MKCFLLISPDLIDNEIQQRILFRDISHYHYLDPPHLLKIIIFIPSKYSPLFQTQSPMLTDRWKLSRQSSIYIANLPCLRKAHPFTAITRMIHAMRKLTMPIVTVKANMAFRSLYSMDETVSWLCFIIRCAFDERLWKTYTSHKNDAAGHQTKCCDKL